MTKSVVTQWRARLAALKDADWVPRIPNKESVEIHKWLKAVQYARNCPPAFVQTQQRSRPCSLYDVCPFCFARRNGRIFDAVDAICCPPCKQQLALPFEGEPAWIRAFTRHLVEFRLTNYWTLQPPTASEILELMPRELVLEQLDADQVTRTGWLRLILRLCLHWRSTLPKSYGLENTVSLITLEPRPDCWRSRIGVLATVPTTEVLPKELTKRRSFRRHDRPTRTVVAQAVARTFPYPIFLLRGDAAATADFLRARVGMRLMAKTGEFRDDSDA